MIGRDADGLHQSIRLSAVLAALALAWACGGDSPTEPPPAPEPARPTTVTVSPATAELTALGATVQLIAEVHDQNGQTMAGATVTWASSAASVAMVNAAGLVTAVGNGTATITATAGSVSGSAAVTVAQEVSAVTVSPDGGTLSALGDVLHLVAEALDASGSAITNAAFAWTSDDTAVATVDGDGVVTAVGNGTATITATAGSVSGSAAVTVAQEVSAVTVSPDGGTLSALGDVLHLVAEALDASGSAITNAAFAWTSDDTAVATVDGDGVVTAVGNGTATITATADSVSGSAAVTVAQEVSAVTVSPDGDTLSALGDVLHLVAEALDASGSAITNAAFAWTSDDTAVATVDGDGVVTAVGNGTATITATAGSVSGSAAVTVAQEVSAVTVSPDGGTLSALGDVLHLVAEALDASGSAITNAAFAWTSDDTAVATVDGDGVVTAVGNGTATITATAGSVSGSAAVTVAQEVSAVTVSPDGGTLSALGDVLHLVAEALDASGSAVTNAAFAWTSDDTAVATVDGDGVVTAVGNGTATITATAGSVSGSATVTVMATPRSAPPTYVFARGIPESTRTLIRNEMEYSRAYFASEHGVEATGFTVLVGVADDLDALAPVYNRMTGDDLIRLYGFSSHTHAWVTSSRQGGTVVTIIIGLQEWSVSTAEYVIVHEYFHVLQQQLAREFESVGNGETRWSIDAPGWTVEGFATFAEYRYSLTRPDWDPFLNDRQHPWEDVAEGIANGELDANDLTRYLNPDRYTGCSWNVWSIYSLGFLATLFLTSRASDDAYVEFWKLLPRHATWEGAFSEAFGLEVDDFFREFQAWLLPQLPTYDLVRMRVSWPERSTDPDNLADVIGIRVDDPSWEHDDRGFRVGIGLAYSPPIRPPLDFEITVPGGTVGTAFLSLWWRNHRNEPAKQKSYLLGWYNDGELTDKREEATPFRFTGASQNAEWTLPAHPTTLPRLGCVQGPVREPCS